LVTETSPKITKFRSVSYLSASTW